MSLSTPKNSPGSSTGHLGPRGAVPSRRPRPRGQSCGGPRDELVGDQSAASPRPAPARVVMVPCPQPPSHPGPNEALAHTHVPKEQGNATSHRQGTPAPPSWHARRAPRDTLPQTPLGPAPRGHQCPTGGLGNAQPCSPEQPGTHTQSRERGRANSHRHGPSDPISAVAPLPVAVFKLDLVVSAGGRDLRRVRSRGTACAWSYSAGLSGASLGP